jgi:hypothetical protein
MGIAMNSKPRYLTKSRFKIGCECPTKLYFTGKPDYGNTKLDNAFLEALAEGGFQVGELAKIYHEGGQCIETLDSAEALRQTAELLKNEKITLYEPAIQFGDLFIRVDVLVKNGKHIELIEVKAKSFDPDADDPFYNKLTLKKNAKKLNTEWQPYLLDIAFQTYVARKAFPQWKVASSLMLANKKAKASVDGLNQRFFLQKDAVGRTRAVVKSGTRRADLGDKVLCKIDVADEVALILENGIDGHSFEEAIASLARAYREDKMIAPTIGSQCKSCEFRIDEEQKSQGIKSGFELCWQKAAGLSDKDVKRPLIFDIWNFRKAQKLIEDGRYFIDDVAESDIDPRPHDGKPGLSTSERQWVQVKKAQEKDLSPHFDAEGMASAMATWRFPLHFIDFETTMVAIPFNIGRRPYEQVAFQFSHHTVTVDGKIEHKTQYINTESGKFPNFDFVRALQAALSADDGTIFRFAAHENTVLCQIYGQLHGSEENDRIELMEWIRSVTTATNDSADKWDGSRSMVDMCELVKLYFYHPLMRGSNSIKKVLPAVLAASSTLQDHYAKPIYGASDGIASKNYKDWQWIKRAPDGSVTDPYKLLPPVFDDLALETMDSIITDGSIADGGAAMTAYARMQFTQMSEGERDRVSSALLKYCELDTFAMVLIYQYWKELIEISFRGKKSA